MNAAIFAHPERLIHSVRLDQYGDDHLIITFRYIPERSPWMVVKVSEKEQGGKFQGYFSLS